MIRRRIRKLAVTLGAMAITAAFCIAAAPSASATALASKHTCVSVGTDGVRQGVFCADLVDNGNGTFAAKGEGICQTPPNSGQTIPCADISMSISLWTVAQGNIANGQAKCGAIVHVACPSGRFISQSASIHMSGCVEAWTVINRGSTIRLPGSGKLLTLGANLGSGHATICG